MRKAKSHLSSVPHLAVTQAIWVVAMHLISVAMEGRMPCGWLHGLDIGCYGR